MFENKRSTHKMGEHNIIYFYNLNILNIFYNLFCLSVR